MSIVLGGRPVTVSLAPLGTRHVFAVAGPAELGIACIEAAAHTLLTTLAATLGDVAAVRRPS